MNKVLDELLCQRYPLIFADRHRVISESCMGWGFSCGDGWYDLIDTLCERLQFWTDHNRAPQVVAAQVKEKYGELCFYTRGDASLEQRGMIVLAEAMSARICDLCGTPGRTVVHDLCHMTRCPVHSPVGAITIEEFLSKRNVLGIAP